MRTKTIVPLSLLMAICIYGRAALNDNGVSPQRASATSNITGTVTFVGKLPASRTINMAADPSCLKQHHEGVVDQPVVTDAKGGLKNAIVFIAEGLNARDFDQPTEPATIDQKGCMYEPHIVAVRANQPLVVENHDPISHNIHPLPVYNREWNKAEPPGFKGQETFSREEVAIPVKCNIHPWMRGYVAVFKHPYFVVTGKEGGFNLSGLPPGTYTIKAWHEKLGTSAQTVTVASNETKAINFIFKFQPGK